MAPSGLYARLCHAFLVYFFLLGAKLSQYLLDRFSRSFHQMEGICVNFLDQVQFFSDSSILCRIGLVRSEPKYLRIRWTDFWKFCNGVPERIAG